MHTRPRWSTQDLALCAGVSALTFVYLAFIWPKILVTLDEGPFIYEAKRILDGDVMYRDFFDLTGPLSQHLLALMYLVAGVSMETARGGTALLHAIIVALAYAVMRGLGVRPLLAAVCCLTDLALFFPAFAMATPHWFSTTFAMIVYWFVLRAPLLTRQHAAIAGALTALVALSQQPKGVATAMAVYTILLYDLWHNRHRTPFGAALAPQLGLLTVTLGGIVLGALVAMIAVAGFWPVFDAIVITPLGPYRDIPFVSEGRWLPLTIDRNLWWHGLSTGSPLLLLNLMPLIVGIAALRLLVRHSTVRSDRRPSFVAVIFGASAIVSVLYLPNHSHFAIVGPLWLPLYGELFERLIRRGERAVRAPWVGSVGVAAVFALIALRVGYDLPRAWTSVGATDRSAFGAVDFASQGEVADVVAVRDAITAAGATDIFVYPSAAALYLMTETSNPTRFQLLMPDYNTAAQVADVQEILERERVPFVVRNLYLWGNKNSPNYRPDRLLPYLSERYELVPLPRLKGSFPTLTLFRRKADTSDSKPVAF